MESERILVPESLAETLWRLEEARRGFRPKSSWRVEEALQWILSRQGLKRAYADLFAPTETDLQGTCLPTGERIGSAALRHILGEEALRAVVLWNHRSSPAAEKALFSFNQLLERGEPCAKDSGFYCCYRCTPAFLRTLATVQPSNWLEILEKGIGNIKKERTPDGRWHGFPFYYTLLTLSEIDTPSARAELKHVSKAAQRLLNQYKRDDRVSRFRRWALEAALSASD